VSLTCIFYGKILSANGKTALCVALNYPPTHFSTFLPDLPSILQSTLLTLLSLLTRLTAHSASSGHTPPTLSPLFGPLLFGLGPATLAFHHTYVHYLRAVNGMEHILLGFIRWQDAPRPTFSTDINTNTVHGSATALGVPTRLKDWIRGYPAMLPFLHEKNKNKRPQARRGARTVQVVSVRRNVRMYSPDLVKTAAGWAQRPRLTANVGDRSLATSKEWSRVAPPTLKLPPRYSENYKKRMDLPLSFHPDTGAGTNSVSSTASSTLSATSTLFDDRDYFGLNGGLTNREGEDRFRSLTDLKWGEFESMGFGVGTDEKKLQFDLTEGARNVGSFITMLYLATDSYLSLSPGSCSETDYSHLERLLRRGLLPNRCPAQRNPPVQHTYITHHLFLALAPGRDSKEAQKGPKGPSCFWLGYRTCCWLRGSHRRGVC
jgi:hypothetical protein